LKTLKAIFYTIFVLPLFIQARKTNENYHIIMAFRPLIINCDYKRFVMFCIVLFSCIMSNFNTTGRSFHSKIVPDNNNTVNTIVIDAGHGGKDPGALGKNSREKDVVLSIALKLGAYIQENYPDVKVIYTRSDDTFIPLYERTDIANKNHADLFISIHANAETKGTASGTETYVMGLDKSESNLEVAKLENSAILLEEDYTTKYEGFDPNSAESYIIFELMQNIFLNQSLMLAANVQDQFRERAKRVDRGVKQERFLVLWRTTMPSVLVETGYITQPDEEKYLSSESGQDYLASAIYRAFKGYKENIESKSVVLNNHTITYKQDSTKVPEIKEVNTANNITYKVQIGSSRQHVLPTPENFKGLKDVSEIQTNDVYKYVVGSYSSYLEVQQFCTEIKKLYPDAFAIAVKNNQIIPVSQAIKELGQ
jgi:N-acetylmuramoyl-L-alanine amidase